MGFSGNIIKIAGRLAAAWGLAAGVGFAIVSCVHGGGGDGAVPAGAAANAQPWLWELSRDGDPPSWLFGTVHVGLDAERDVPKAVWQAFNGAGCFITEADLGAVTPQALLSMGSLPEGKSLESLVSKEAWARLSDRLADRVPDRLLPRLEPWFVTILYMQEISPPHAGVAIDALMLEQARRSGKRLEYLEDWREAMSAFASVTTVSDLEDLVKDEAAARAEIGRMVEAYRSGDEARLLKVMAEIDAQTPGSDEKNRVLLAGRNRRWLPRLTASLRSAPASGCLVAVGAGHLIGGDNLRDLLAKAGYRSRRVPAPATMEVPR